MNIHIERRSGLTGNLRAVVIINGAVEIGFDRGVRQWYFLTIEPRRVHLFPKLKAALAAWRLMR